MYHFSEWELIPHIRTCGDYRFRDNGFECDKFREYETPDQLAFQSSLSADYQHLVNHHCCNYGASHTCAHTLANTHTPKHTLALTYMLWVDTHQISIIETTNYVSYLCKSSFTSRCAYRPNVLSNTLPSSMNCLHHISLKKKPENLN